MNQPKSPSLPGLPLDTIIQGDCREGLASLPEACLDLVFADPPYNLQLQGKLLRPNQSKVDGVDDEWDKFASFKEYDAFTESWLTGCRRAMKDEASLWVIGSYHNIFRIGAMLMDMGFWIINDVIWHKTNPMPNFRGTRFQNATETMIWAQKSGGGKNPTFNYHAMKRLNDDKQMGNVWNIPLCTGSERIKGVDGVKAHATQKPLQLLYRVILASSNPGDVVLDPFMGSGTTAAAARILGRRFIGFEADPGYVSVARQRLEGLEAVAEPELLLSPSRRDRPRLPFSALVESQAIPAGTKLYSRNRRHEGVVMADSSVKTKAGIGSIHKSGALVQDLPACNGWDFWHLEDAQGALRPLDECRQKALENSGSSDTDTSSVPAKGQAAA
ncbi:MAG: site-specific DNA-methyltransferase [Alphaproteobacteria bacterium]|nr:MAG: site-specific DNA-methyltransferase [Alphaproteobacteria bacterium]